MESKKKKKKKTTTTTTTTISAEQFFMLCMQEANEALRYCFVTRATDLQRKNISNLSSLLAEVTQFKKQARDAKKEGTANALLSIQCLLTAVRSELEMWILLKNDQPGQAWELLVSAQENAASALRAYPKLEVSGLIERLAQIEKVVFPHQTFMSTGLIVGRTECTICGQEYEDCPHVKGRAYMGEFCCEKVTEIVELLEVSFVDDPSSKRCRVYSCGKVDVMTLKEVDDEVGRERSSKDGDE